MVSVLNIGQALGQVSFMMIIYVRQVRHAGAPVIAFYTTLLQLGPENVPYRFTSRGIATLLYQLVECGGQTLVKRNGKSIHVISSCYFASSIP
jgi:hypothetical protein